MTVKRLKLLKTISYRIISSAIGLIAIYIISGSLKAGATFSIVEFLYKPIQYYLHERLWLKTERKTMIDDNP